MRVAQWVMEWAARLLPPHRRDWAEAMRAELAAIPSREAFGFALGCLWAAFTERTRLMKAIVTFGRWGVGIVTIVYGAFFVQCLVNGLTQAELRNPDLPWLLAWQCAMGFSHMAAGLFLILWRPRAFAFSCAIATLPALGLALLGVLNHMPRPNSYVWPFLPLALLLAAAAFLRWLDREPSQTAAA